VSCEKTGRPILTTCTSYDVFLLKELPFVGCNDCSCDNILVALFFNKSSALAQMGDRLATIDMGRKLGAVPLFGGEGAGSSSNTMSPKPTPISVPSGILIHPAVRPQQIWAENWWGGGLCPFWRKGAGCQSNTMWPGPRPTSVPSGILIHPAVWP